MQTDKCELHADQRHHTIVSSFINNISILFLYPTFFSFQPSFVTVQPGLCLTLSETPDRFFARRGSNVCVFACLKPSLSILCSYIITTCVAICLHLYILYEWFKLNFSAWSYKWNRFRNECRYQTCTIVS